MIIVTHKAGRLGNRLFHFSNFIVNSLANDYKLIYPFFDEYAKYFPYFDDLALNKKNIFLSFSRIKLLDKWTKLLVKYFFHYKLFIGRYNINLFFIKLFSLYYQDRNNISYDLNGSQIINNCHRILFLNGWLFRDTDNASQYSSYLKEVFRPREEYLLKINNIIATCRKGGDIVIGVHIRRGDYRTYADGQYYLDDEVYLNRMKIIEKKFLDEGKKCTFLICSNEKIDLANFSDVKTVFADEDLITDMYSLAKADYIIGPPSTFTMWASFYGSVPLLVIDNRKENILLSDFKIVKNL